MEIGGRDVKKIKDVVVYKDDLYYSCFPSIVRRPDGELIVAFRRAPDRRRHGGTNLHVHANSYLVLVRSRDDGETWTKEPEPIHAHSMGGSQDPCMTQLSDGAILCASYLWTLLPPESDQGVGQAGQRYGFGGGYLMRSTDGGHSWEGPILPPAVPGSEALDPLGRPLPAFNRGAMLEGTDGLLYWVVASRAGGRDDTPTAAHLLVSRDKGSSWEYRCPVAVDDAVGFNETCLVETPAGDLVAFIRTQNLEGRTVVARSKDRGRSFAAWTDAGFYGFPHDCRHLPDGRALLVYGYRREPCGVRARILNAECADYAQTEEFVIRDDGGTGDLGYPWIQVLPDGRAWVVYYFNRDNGARFIAGSLLDPNG